MGGLLVEGEDLGLREKLEEARREAQQWHNDGDDPVDEEAGNAEGLGCEDAAERDAYIAAAEGLEQEELVDALPEAGRGKLSQ